MWLTRSAAANMLLQRAEDRMVLLDGDRVAGLGRQVVLREDHSRLGADGELADHNTRPINLAWITRVAVDESYQ